MTTLSAVVQLIDAYSRQPAVAAQACFLLDGRLVRPQAKPQAFYAFVGLDAGHYRLAVSSPEFLPQQVSLQVPLDLSSQHSLADAIVPCELQPGPTYPYPHGTTLVRGLVVDARHRRPLAGVLVCVRYQDARQRARSGNSRTAGLDDGSGRIGSRYHGRYALALPGKLGEQPAATLQFSLPGYLAREQRVEPQAGEARFLDVELQPMPEGIS